MADVSTNARDQIGAQAELDQRRADELAAIGPHRFDWQAGGGGCVACGAGQFNPIHTQHDCWRLYAPGGRRPRAHLLPSHLSRAIVDQLPPIPALCGFAPVGQGIGWLGHTGAAEQAIARELLLCKRCTAIATLVERT